jgi:hypothetical protein
MKKPGFFRGVIVAGVLALVGSIAFSGLSLILGGAVALKILLTLLAGAYVLYLLSASAERTGRVAVFTAWLLVTSCIWFFTADLALMMIAQAVSISIVRSLYHHAGVLAGLLDLVLSAFALSAAVWASAQSGSMFLVVWCFFLVQALFVGIPTSFKSEKQQSFAQELTQEDEFGRACRTAETAIRRIATQR